jgi:hypothetical protein
MRKLVATFFTVGALAIGTAPAFAAEHHPPKFGPHDLQCQSDPNQPWCPGSH